MRPRRSHDSLTGLGIVLAIIVGILYVILELAAYLAIFVLIIWAALHFVFHAV